MKTWHGSLSNWLVEFAMVEDFDTELPERSCTF